MLWDSSPFILQRNLLEDINSTPASNPKPDLPPKQTVTIFFEWKLCRFPGWDRWKKKCFENYFTPSQEYLERGAFAECFVLLRDFFGQFRFASQQFSLISCITFTLHHLVTRQLSIFSSPLNAGFGSAPCCISARCTIASSPCLLIRSVSSLSVRGKYNFYFPPKCSSSRQNNIKWLSFLLLQYIGKHITHGNKLYQSPWYRTK